MLKELKDVAQRSSPTLAQDMAGAMALVLMLVAALNMARPI